jgi:hypothetical protein
VWNVLAVGVRIEVDLDDEVTDESIDLGTINLSERDRDMVCILIEYNVDRQFTVVPNLNSGSNKSSN